MSLKSTLDWLLATRPVRVATGAASRFSEADGMRAGAAIAFYAAFSIAPLLVVLTGVLSWLWGNDGAQEAIFSSLKQLIGPRETQTLAELLSRSAEASSTGQQWTGSLVAAATTLIGATGVFMELRNALQSMLSRDPLPWRWWDLLKVRLMAIGIILGAGFLMAVAMVVQTLALAGIHWLARQWPDSQAFLMAFELLFSWTVIVGLFSIIMRWLPDIRLPYRQALIGAALSATLFMLGRYAISYYITDTVIQSPLGAASSFAALLVWVYWSSQIFLLGAALAAELTPPDGPPPASPDELAAAHSASPAASPSVVSTVDTVPDNVPDSPPSSRQAS